MTPTLSNRYTKLTNEQIERLQQQGCFSENWATVYLSDGIDLTLIRNVCFYGKVAVGILKSCSDFRQGIYNATLCDCIIGDNVYIHNIHGQMKGVVVGNRVVIDNVGRIEFEPYASCGIGTEVCVLDETGSRAVKIYPGISAQVATLAALKPKWNESHLSHLISEKIEKLAIRPEISDDVVIRDSGVLKNLFIGKKVKIEGASNLVDGSVINNSTGDKSLTYIGNGVDAEHFIMEDSIVATNVILRNCYIGQGCKIEKGFTAHDSMFFANCACENGEACAVLAAPYTVSMHKSSLLIGGLYSFTNIGSGTNASNHMYKLGPIHWGIMERGVKTSSGSYVMWNGRIGAFSLIMGAHKHHPDTAEFPFSYLFSDEHNRTIVAPGLMLKSCGLVRDEQKWKTRDNRRANELPLNDNICFDVLNPYTIGRMVVALKLLDKIKATQETGGFYQYNGLLFKPSAIEKGKEFYKTAILKYLYDKFLHTRSEISVNENEMPQQWVDFSGQILPQIIVEQALKSESIDELNDIFNDAYSNYNELEQEWVRTIVTTELKQIFVGAKNPIEAFEKMTTDDRNNYLEMVKSENKRYSL